MVKKQSDVDGDTADNILQAIQKLKTERDALKAKVESARKELAEAVRARNILEDDVKQNYYHRDRLPEELAKFQREVADMRTRMAGASNTLSRIWQAHEHYASEWRCLQPQLVPLGAELDYLNGRFRNLEAVGGDLVARMIARELQDEPRRETERGEVRE